MILQGFWEMIEFRSFLLHLTHCSDPVLNILLADYTHSLITDLPLHSRAFPAALGPALPISEPCCLRQTSHLI